jgi:chemosensory pili system protein ChpA (sensor histidine kinase/response regulator)
VETDRSGKELTWTFLMDAWDALAALEEGVKGIGTSDGAAAARHIVIVSHRLKGTAALYGFPLVSRVAAAVERAFDSIPPGQDPSPGAVGLVREAASLIHHGLDVIALGTGEDEPRFAAFRRKHALFFGDDALSPDGPPAQARTEPVESAPPSALRLEDSPTPFPEALTDAAQPASPLGGLRNELDGFFHGNPDAAFFVPEAEEHLETATNALQAESRHSDPASAVATLFRAFHTLKGAAYTVGCSPIGALAHRVEDLLSKVRSGRSLDAEVEAVLYLALDTLRSMLPGRTGPEADVETAYASVLAAVDGVLAGETSTQPTPAGPVPSSPPPVFAPVPATAPPAPRAAPFGSTIRVHLDRLEGLLNLAADLIIIKGKLDRHVRELEAASAEMTLDRKRLALTIREFAGKHVNPQLGHSTDTGDGDGREARGLAGFSDLEFERYDDFNVLARSVGELDEDLGDAQAGLHSILNSVRSEMETLGTVVRDLRKSVSRVRLVPIGQLFTRFRRLVRQQEREVGKTVHLETRGENVEIDNVILEKLSDPLLHLVRNALAHGIEAPEERLRLGKDPIGLVRLVAYSRGNKVWIEVGDDGAGMNRAALRSRGLALGLLTRDQAENMRVEDATDLIFLPGFSTMEASTTGAGRGVGLDVVRTDILRLKGEIEVKSEPGRGTTFILKVPLTLIVSQALLVGVAARTFAFPVSAVETLLSLGADDVRKVGGREVIAFRGDDLPVLRLRPLLGLSGPDPAGEIVGVIVNAAGRRIVVLVDRALGSEDVVLKSLGAFMESLTHYQGAAISASGQLVLVLDPVGLLALDAPAPVRTPEHSGLFALPDHVRAARRTSGGPTRILLVDDSVSVRKVVGRMLESAGFEVVTAADGMEALERLHDTVFSAVITDLEMPRLNGFELIQQLRNRDALKGLPILVLTTRVGERHVRVARELGATGFLSKPVVEERLVTVVRRACMVGPAADA